MVQDGVRERYRVMDKDQRSGPECQMGHKMTLGVTRARSLPLETRPVKVIDGLPRDVEHSIAFPYSRAPLRPRTPRMRMNFRILYTALLAVAAPAPGAPGLWQPQQLPAIEAELRGAGIAVDPRELSDPQRYPLNAVVELGDDCTAALVSSLGLLLGSRLCVLDALRSQSIEGRDLLADGLVARTLGEEMPGAPSVRVTQSVQDVTAQVLAGGASGQDSSARAQAIDARSRRLLAACESSPGYRCRIDVLRDGEQYSLVRQLVIRDVRVAYVSAGGAAEFGDAGGHPSWPRQRADVALLRAYVGPDGRPADYSEVNVPLRPASHVKLQAAGLASGDFAMTVGYPGRAVDGDGSLRVGFGKVLAVTVSGAQLAANFIADFDLASGSSGWPVLNARAELVGVALAGSPGEVATERLSYPAQAHSVALDIRFVLGSLDAADDGDRLLRELVVDPVAVDAR